MPLPRPVGRLPGFGEQHALRRPWPSPMGRVPTSPPLPSTLWPQPAQDEAYRAPRNDPKHRPFATSVPYAN